MKKNIAVVPFDDTFRNNNLFVNNKDNTKSAYKSIFDSFDCCYEINTVDYYSNSLKEVQLVIFLGLDYNVLFKSIINKTPSIYIAIESPIIENFHYQNNLLLLEQFFDSIFTYNMDLLSNSMFKPLFYSYKINPEDLSDINLSSPKHLLTQIASNLYSPHVDELYGIRKKINEEMSLLLGSEYHYYGKNWDGSDLSYCGVADNKIETLSKYKFNFCIENCLSDNWYLSEKILDSFLANSVPIYLGTSKVSELIPEGCFIDLRLFDSIEDVYLYIRSINDHKYNEYIDCINKFLKSDNSKIFRIEHLANNLKIEVESILNKEQSHYKVLSLKTLIKIYVLANKFRIKRKVKCLLNCLGIKRYQCYRN